MRNRAKICDLNLDFINFIEEFLFIKWDSFLSLLYTFFYAVVYVNVTIFCYYLHKTNMYIVQPASLFCKNKLTLSNIKSFFFHKEGIKKMVKKRGERLLISWRSVCLLLVCAREVLDQNGECISNHWQAGELLSCTVGKGYKIFRNIRPRIWF